MKNSDRDRFDGRLKTANEAKQSKLERFQAAAEEPERLAKLAERNELALAREAKRQAKAAKLLEEKKDRERQKAEDAAREKEQAATRDAGIAEIAAQAAAKSKPTEAERKAERDRRYAARRNRKR